MLLRLVQWDLPCNGANLQGMAALDEIWYVDQCNNGMLLCKVFISFVLKVVNKAPVQNSPAHKCLKKSVACICYTLPRELL